ncbi:uncharacterized protein LOC133931445 [Phragmites australis]|uniref:uncharacterized protein LOC133931445 n=1 Tax=Phragmites australis TaxID=29695 RepID=UPI002D780168|nr:uncharacterized protein LOC133931445 [Phragmites australis]
MAIRNESNQIVLFLNLSDFSLIWILPILTLPLTLTVDRNRTISRRSKPNSRTTFIGKQPNLWDLQPQDVMSRHQCAKRLRR